METKKYSIFIERFFNRRKFSDIASQLNVSLSVCKSRYYEAVRDIETVVQVLDNRFHASKCIQRRESNRYKFNRDEKAFLMCYIFDFTAKEVAEILNCKEVTLQKHVQRMERKFRAGFDAVTAE
jgi:DNA-directed RNA polymerase specialized sigma24 family protein